MRDIVLNLSEQTLSKTGNCDYSNIVRGSDNYQRNKRYISRRLYRNSRKCEEFTE